MWIEELAIENIRCFESAKLRFSRHGQPCKWVTLLGENSGGKSTILQSIALLLAGPEGSQQLAPRPIGWLRDEEKVGKIGTRIHQGNQDPGQHGDTKVRKVFGYSFNLTGSRKLTVNQKVYTEPTIVPIGQHVLTWLRENALNSKGTGWFAVGYGAFRRLTRSSQIIVPSLEPQARFTNFLSQFREDEALATFERWMVYLDYRIAKGKGDEAAQHQKQLGVDAINQVLPRQVKFHSVSPEGRILFDVGGAVVQTIALSDGYRSVLALTGDLIWRLIQAFPGSKNPLVEEGVVLIDELDIHLHPKWQREIAGWLRSIFPNLQFIIATHSPLIAAGAGEDSLTLCCQMVDGVSQVSEVENVAAKSVDAILQSPAFGLVSAFAPATQTKLDRFDVLSRKAKRTSAEEDERQMLLNFVEVARPYGGPPEPGSLDAKVEAFLEKTLS